MFYKGLSKVSLKSKSYYLRSLIILCTTNVKDNWVLCVVIMSPCIRRQGKIILTNYIMFRDVPLLSPPTYHQAKSSTTDPFNDFQYALTIMCTDVYIEMDVWNHLLI